MKPRRFKTDGALQAFLFSRPAAAYQILILHDDACTPSRCSCRPWYELRDLTTDNVLEGIEMQDEWMRKVTS